MTGLHTAVNLLASDLRRNVPDLDEEEQVDICNRLPDLGTMILESRDPRETDHSNCLKKPLYVQQPRPYVGKS